METINHISAADPLRSARGRRHPRTQRVGLLLGVAMATALLAGCGGSSSGGGGSSSGATVAHLDVTHIDSTTTSKGAGSTTNSKASTNAKAKPSAVALAKCMRAHGVPSYPEPPSHPPSNPSGTSSYLGNGPNPNSPTYQVAEQACRKYAVGLATRVSAAGAEQVQAQQLKYARCMRTHGVPDFPDPSANGGLTIPKSVDQNSSIFKAAESACRGLLPVIGPPGSGG